MCTMYTDCITKNAVHVCRGWYSSVYCCSYDKNLYSSHDTYGVNDWIC